MPLLPEGESEPELHGADTKGMPVLSAARQKGSDRGPGAVTNRTPPHAVLIQPRPEEREAK
eukprot:349706-Chlamydomonas_euryale.AAC.6